MRSKPLIFIDLDNPHDVYTSHMRISGTVNFSLTEAIQFEAIQIMFEGIARTRINQIGIAGPSMNISGKHTFLRMLMPIPPSSYPQPPVLAAGSTYRFPFTFAVPSKLLSNACQHVTVGNCLHDDHLQTPPSMGSYIDDDSSSEAAGIQYAITARLMKDMGQDGPGTTILGASRPVNIIPDSVEWPPLTFDLINNDYVLQKRKSLRKHLFSGELGKITIMSKQPASIVVKPSRPDIPASSTKLVIAVCFHPADDQAQPPRIGNARSSLRSSTFYSSRPNETVPSRAAMLKDDEDIRRIFETSCHLASHNMSSVKWTKQIPMPVREGSHGYDRDGNTYCACSGPIAQPSSSLGDYTTPAAHQRSYNPYYNTSIVVPITLSSTKLWLPTFHSCLISRVYTIDVTLLILSSMPGLSMASLTLKIPVQILAVGSAASMPGTQSEVAELLDLSPLQGLGQRRVSDLYEEPPHY